MKSKSKKIIGLGIFAILFLAVSVIYSINFNDSRLVVPMDFSTYAFHPKDLPMILSIAFFIIYVLALVTGIIITMFRSQMKGGNSAGNYTRNISPKLGYLGFFGFFGFLGFWTYASQNVIFPFIFFMFFGFFGFYYEGKLSNTLMDERFADNVKNAQLTSYKIGFILLFLVLIITGNNKLPGSLDFYAIFLVISLSLICGLILFLSEYLLYRYDKKD